VGNADISELLPYWRQYGQNAVDVCIGDLSPTDRATM
jgi:hypothetical protein